MNQMIHMDSDLKSIMLSQGSSWSKLLKTTELFAQENSYLSNSETLKMMRKHSELTGKNKRFGAAGLILNPSISSSLGTIQAIQNIGFYSSSALAKPFEFYGLRGRTQLDKAIQAGNIFTRTEVPNDAEESSTFDKLIEEVANSKTLDGAYSKLEKLRNSILTTFPQSHTSMKAISYVMQFVRKKLTWQNVFKILKVLINAIIAYQGIRSGNEIIKLLLEIKSLLTN